VFVVDAAAQHVPPRQDAFIIGTSQVESQDGPAVREPAPLRFLLRNQRMACYAACPRIPVTTL